MFGLILADPSCDRCAREAVRRLLHDLDVPLSGFTDAPAPGFSADEGIPTFLREASSALLQPGRPLPMDALCACLAHDALNANIIRRYVFLQLSLLPYLRPGRTVTPLTGCFLVGEDLLVAPVRPDDTVDALLPPGLWTELTGETHRGRLRAMRGYNELPVLAGENALLPIGVNDRTADHDDADRLTLHWFQPAGEASCTLQDGTVYHAYRRDGRFSTESATDRPFHLVVHLDGETILCR